MRSLSLVGLTTATLACLGIAPRAHAQSLTYMLTGTGSGQFDTTAGRVLFFTDQPFTLTETAPVSGLSTFNGSMYNFSGPVTVDFEGNSGTAMLYGVGLYNSPGTTTSYIGFVDITFFGVTGVTTTAGPLTLTAPQSPLSLSFSFDGPIETSFGRVLFSSATNLTFSSFVPTAAVPEPDCMALFATALLSGAGLLVCRRRIVRHAA